MDGVFADCYNRWGGRFSLIAPCANGRIAPSYWPWLEAFDPDIVYSYVPLNRADVLEVHERLSPAQYAFHNQGRVPRLDVHGFKPSYGFSPLSSLSTIVRLARYSPTAREGAPVKIIDSWPPNLDLPAGRWSGSFNLVVGDNFADRILFWNARLLLRAWLDTDLCC